MRQLTVALLLGVVIFAAVWVLAVAPAMTGPASGGEAQETADGWDNISFFGSP